MSRRVPTPVLPPDAPRAPEWIVEGVGIHALRLWRILGAWGALHEYRPFTLRQFARALDCSIPTATVASQELRLAGAMERRPVVDPLTGAFRLYEYRLHATPIPEADRR